jgi:TRAP-type C4-dicarboxylate transport system permease small subunit
MMGAAAGLKGGGQVAVTTLKERLEKRNSKKAVAVLQGIVYTIMLVFFIIMIYYGAIQTVANYTQRSSTMSIPMSFPYAALPLGFIMMFLITLEQLVSLPREYRTGGK